VPLYGDNVNSLQTEYIIVTVNSGTYYKFVYRARNTHGDGLDSEPVTILAATVPVQMAEPTILFSEVDLSYVINLQAPNSGGLGVPILAYDINVQAKDLSFITPSTCVSS